MLTKHNLSIEMVRWARGLIGPVTRHTAANLSAYTQVLDRFSTPSDHVLAGVLLSLIYLRASRAPKVMDRLIRGYVEDGVLNLPEDRWGEFLDDALTAETDADRLMFKLKWLTR